MTSNLKGTDADVYRARRDLQLQPALQVIYDDDECAELGIMLDEIMEAYYDPYNDRCRETLVKIFGGVPVSLTEDTNLGDSRWVKAGKSKFIIWASPSNERNQVQDVTVAREPRFYRVHIL